MDDTASDLIARWRQGDQQAADELFRRYAEQLIVLARSRLSAKLSQRIDAEDVVQSACRSFFSAARDGRYDLQRGGDIWRLLVSITLHKLHHQVRWNSAEKRSVDRERTVGERTGFDLAMHLASREPSPVEAVALADAVEQIMRNLDEASRQILELRLQGYNLEEIAAQTERSERTVCRVLDRVKKHLEQPQHSE